MRSVIKIILQFCKENSLTDSFTALQRECQVSLNTVDSLDTFTADINAGRWDTVLPAVGQLQLPRSKLEDLYEQVWYCAAPGKAVLLGVHRSWRRGHAVHACATVPVGQCWISAWLAGNGTLAMGLQAWSG